MRTELELFLRLMKRMRGCYFDWHIVFILVSELHITEEEIQFVDQELEKERKTEEQSKEKNEIAVIANDYIGDVKEALYELHKQHKIKDDWYNKQINRLTNVQISIRELENE